MRVYLQAFLAYLALAFLIAWPTLDFGRANPANSQPQLAFGTDTIAHDAPINLYGWRRVSQEGRWPLWSDELRGGLPFMAVQAFMPLYPPNWMTGAVTHLAGRASSFDLAAQFRAYMAMHSLQWPLHWALGAVFMFGFLRRVLRASQEEMLLVTLAAFVGGIVYGFSPHIITLTYPGHLAKVQAIAWIPAALWAFTFDFQQLQSNLRRAMLTGAALAMMLLAGHPQIFVYGVLITILWGAWQTALPAGNVTLEFMRRGFYFLRGIVVCGVTCFLIASPQLLPLIEFIPHSNRSSLGYEEATKSSYPPVEFVELLLPRHRSDSVLPVLGGESFYSGPWGERLVSDYVGIYAVLLALIALIRLPERHPVFGAGNPQRTSYLTFFHVAIIVAGLFLCMGSYLGGIYRFLYDYIPPFGSFRSPATAMVLIPLGMAGLAATGFGHFISTIRSIEGIDGHAQPGVFYNSGWLGYFFPGAILLCLLLGVFLFGWSGYIPNGYFNWRESLNDDQINVIDRRLYRQLFIAIFILGGFDVILNSFGDFPRNPINQVFMRFPVTKKIVPRMVIGVFLISVVLMAFDYWPTWRAFIKPAPVVDIYHSQTTHIPSNNFLLSNRHSPNVLHFDVTEPQLPPALLLEGRELSPWPILFGWSNPWAYHPVFLSSQQRTMEKYGYDSTAFLALVRHRPGNSRQETSIFEPEVSPDLTMDRPSERERIIELKRPYYPGWKYSIRGATGGPEEVHSLWSPGRWFADRISPHENLKTLIYFQDVGANPPFEGITVVISDDFVLEQSYEPGSYRLGILLLGSGLFLSLLLFLSGFDMRQKEGI